MLVLQDCIEKLSAFKQTFGRQFGITKLGIFGSVARQENTEDSDIDIVVEIEKPTLSLMYELREKLKALFNCNVDLVRFRSTLRPLFKSNILNDVVYVKKICLKKCLCGCAFWVKRTAQKAVEAE